MIDQQDLDLYDEVGAALADVHLDRGPDDVIRRGRTLRRRRRAMPALAVAGVLAFSLGVATVTSQSHSSSKVALVNVDEAAFSVHTDAETGDVTVTIRELFDENQFKRVLADAGVPAVFHEENLATSSADGRETMEACTWTGAKVTGSANVITHQASGRNVAYTIVPSAIPHGFVLAFDYASLPEGGHMTSAVLLTNTPTGCEQR